MTNLRITAHATLGAGRPISLRRVGESQIRVVTRSADSSLIELFDEHLRPVEQRHIADLIIDVAHSAAGDCWLLTPEGASLVGADQTLAPPVREPRDPELDALDLRAMTFAGDDLLLVRQHPRRGAQAAARVTRVTKNGEQRWSTRLAPTELVHSGVVEMRATDAWKPRVMKPWQPQTWFLQNNNIPIADERALLTFSEMPRSGIGFGYVVSLEDGSVLHTTKRGPISETAAHPGGGFLVGYQGYGDFKTLLYGRDGEVENEWPTHGFYIVDDVEVRVVEMENSLPSKMCLAMLKKNGHVDHGARLGGYYTSPPLLREDGSVFFVRDGNVVLCRGLDVSCSAPISSGSDRTLGTESVKLGGALFVAVQVGVAQGDAWELLRVEVIPESRP